MFSVVINPGNIRPSG